MKTTIRLCSLAAIVAVGAAFLPASAQAAFVEIGFTGLNITYDGSEISATGGVDALTSVSITEDDVPVSGSPFGSDIDIELSIPGVTGIDAAGETITSVGDGSLTLGLPSGDELTLTLEPSSITYVNVPSVIEFSFAGTVAEILSQSLPTSLDLSNPVSVTFATTILPGSVTTSLGVVTGFEATGTGEIEAFLVPEPATAIMAIAAALFVIRRRK